MAARNLDCDKGSKRNNFLLCFKRVDFCLACRGCHTGWEHGEKVRHKLTIMQQKWQLNHDLMYLKNQSLRLQQYDSTAAVTDLFPNVFFQILRQIMKSIRDGSQFSVKLKTDSLELSWKRGPPLIFSQDATEIGPEAAILRHCGKWPFPESLIVKPNSGKYLRFTRTITLRSRSKWPLVTLNAKRIALDLKKVLQIFTFTEIDLNCN